MWDGEELRVASKCNMESLSWWDVVRLGWKYRLSLWRFRRAVLSNLEKWKSFASQHTFDNIVKELKDVGLDGLILASAENYLGNISIGPRFQSDFVQPCTRARFAQNLADVRGFSSLMAAGVSKATSVDGGNNRVIERMIKLSKADLHLNSQVIKISPRLSSTLPAFRRSYLPGLYSESRIRGIRRCDSCSVTPEQQGGPW